MNDQSSIDSIEAKKKNPYAVWFVVFSFVAPVVLAYIMFYFVEVTSFTNRGEIFKPVIAIETLGLRDESGVLIEKKELTFKWRIYSFVGSDCDESCDKRLFEIRQIHTRLGKNAHRVLRVVVHLDKPDAAFAALLKNKYPETLNMIGDEATITQAIAHDAKIRDNEIYITDPMGHMMMRFTQDQPIIDINFDFRKLLKASQIG